ncbi:LytTR family DNA-binding domain-containing protein [uncultured Lacinutrix sp.]|uniref:LytTR family DNA-binding domain-containing protein n=1 Tax=uncultured Lacinutrix sp. TaxID=574032 RepID=UPI002626A326|nr:LytTR family DNA-binding domain-containing protein [uncultured Lacinutrix sp.]
MKYCFTRKILIAFLAISLITTNCLYSQTKDSIEVVLNNLNRKAHVLKNNSDSLHYYTNKIIKLADEYNLPIYKIRAYSVLSSAYRLKREYEKSLDFCHKAKNLSGKLNYTRDYYNNLNTIGLIHLRTSYYDSAVHYFRKIEKYYLNEKPSLLLHRTRMNLGNAYLNMDSLDFSLINYKLSNNGFKSIKRQPKVNINLVNLITANNLSIARIYFLKNDFINSLKYADSSLLLAEKNKNFRILPSIYMVKTNIYNELGNVSESKKYVELQILSDTLKVNHSQISQREPRNLKQRARDINDNKERNIKFLEEKAVELSSFKKAFNKNRIVYSLLLFGVFLLAFYSFIRWKKTDKKKQLLAIENEKTKTELETVKSLVTNDYIVLKNKSKVYLKELIYVKSDGHYLNLFTTTKKEFVRGKISEMESELPPNFVKCHRSYIVNENFVKQYNSTEVSMENGDNIPLSRGFKF